MEQYALKNVNNGLNTNIYSYLETYRGQSSNLFLNVVHFLTPLLIRHLCQLTTVVFLHWCLIWAVVLILWWPCVFVTSTHIHSSLMFVREVSSPPLTMKSHKGPN
jgi:hypothetical protein